MNELFAKRTGIGFALKVVGLAVIVWGIIQGFIFIMTFGGVFSNGIGIGSFLYPIFIYSVCGILIIGFGEVIDLLQKIHDQNDPKAQALQSIGDNSVAIANASIPLSIAQEKDYYSNKNIWADSISPTKTSNVFSLKINGRTEYIELGGLTPKILSEEETTRYFG